METTTADRLPDRYQIEKADLPDLTRAVLIRRCVAKQTLATVGAAYELDRRMIRQIEVAGLRSMGVRYNR